MRLSTKSLVIRIVKFYKAGNLAFLKTFLEFFKDDKLLSKALVSLGSFGRFGYSSFKYLKVGENKLEIDGLYIPYRVNGAVDMHDVGIVKTTDDMHDGVNFTDV